MTLKEMVPNGDLTEPRGLGGGGWVGKRATEHGSRTRQFGRALDLELNLGEQLDRSVKYVSRCGDAMRIRRYQK